jgi:hypothetical protein
MTSTTIDGGLKALKWSLKKYYTEYVDHIDAEEIWAALSEGPLVRVAFFLTTASFCTTCGRTKSTSIG